MTLLRRHGEVLACTAASVVWLLAFSWGARTGILYVTLGAVALGVVVGSLTGGFGASASLRKALVPRAQDVVLGGLVGAASLGATHVAFRPLAGVVPGLGVEVARLYEIASVTPLVLLPVALIVVAEELLWRGALPSALERDTGPVLAVVLSSALYAAAQLGVGSAWLGLAAVGLGTLWSLEARVTQRLVAPLLSHAIWTFGVLGFWRLPLPAGAATGGP